MASILFRRQAAALPSLLLHPSAINALEQHTWASAAPQLVQLRFFSNAPPPSSSSSSSPPSTPPPPSTHNREAYVYEAPFSGAVKKVKKLSLFSCACAVAAGPIILGLDATTTLTAKASITGTLSSFGIFTTGLLHWFTSPYIHKLVYDPVKDSVDVTTLSLFGGSPTHSFLVKDAHPSDSVHPLSSFAAGGRIYYLDRDSFKDKDLLERLVPAPEVAVTEQHPPPSS